MNVLDENIIDNQRRQLMSWRMRIHQIGFEVGRKGMKDREVIPFLHQLKQPTFFTRDDDFLSVDCVMRGIVWFILMSGKKKSQLLFVAYCVSRHSKRKPGVWAK